MSLDPLTAGLGLADTIVKRIWADPAEQAKQLSEFAKMDSDAQLAWLNANLQTMLGQIEIDKIEAASPHFWNSGWRPYIGWICGTVVALFYIPYALAAVALWSVASWKGIMLSHDLTTFVLPPKPEIGMADVIMLLSSLLGIAGLRTYEKSQGIDTKSSAPISAQTGIAGMINKFLGK